MHPSLYSLAGFSYNATWIDRTLYAQRIHGFTPEQIDTPDACLHKTASSAKL
jgi:hypothetical protein